MTDDDSDEGYPLWGEKCNNTNKVVSSDVTDVTSKDNMNSARQTKGGAKMTTAEDNQTKTRRRSSRKKNTTKEATDVPKLPVAIVDVLTWEKFKRKAKCYFKDHPHLYENYEWILSRHERELISHEECLLEQRLMFEDYEELLLQFDTLVSTADLLDDLKIKLAVFHETISSTTSSASFLPHIMNAMFLANHRVRTSCASSSRVVDLTGDVTSPHESSREGGTSGHEDAFDTEDAYALAPQYRPERVARRKVIEAMAVKRRAIAAASHQQRKRAAEVPALVGIRQFCDEVRTRTKDFPRERNDFTKFMTHLLQYQNGDISKADLQRNVYQLLSRPEMDRLDFMLAMSTKRIISAPRSTFTSLSSVTSAVSVQQQRRMPLLTASQPPLIVAVVDKGVCKSSAGQNVPRFQGKVAHIPQLKRSQSTATAIITSSSSSSSASCSSVPSTPHLIHPAPCTVLHYTNTAHPRSNEREEGEVCENHHEINDDEDRNSGNCDGLSVERVSLEAAISVVTAPEVVTNIVIIQNKEEDEDEEEDMSISVGENRPPLSNNHMPSNVRGLSRSTVVKSPKLVVNATDQPVTVPLGTAVERAVRPVVILKNRTASSRPSSEALPLPGGLLPVQVSNHHDCAVVSPSHDPPASRRSRTTSTVTAIVKKGEEKKKLAVPVVPRRSGGGKRKYNRKDSTSSSASHYEHKEKNVKKKKKNPVSELSLLSSDNTVTCPDIVPVSRPRRSIGSSHAVVSVDEGEEEKEDKDNENSYWPKEESDELEEPVAHRAFTPAPTNQFGRSTRSGNTTGSGSGSAGPKVNVIPVSKKSKDRREDISAQEEKFRNMVKEEFTGYPDYWKTFKALIQDLSDSAVYGASMNANLYCEFSALFKSHPELMVECVHTYPQLQQRQQRQKVK